MLRLVKAEQMDSKIHKMEAPVFFLQCYFNFLKLIITSETTIRNHAPIDKNQVDRGKPTSPKQIP